MLEFRDVHDRNFHLTEERQRHLETDHPEMRNQIVRIDDTLLNPDCIIQSRTDPKVEMFYKWYPVTPVTSKFLCVVVKLIPGNSFILTAYYTDTVKKGALLWEKP